MFLPISKQYGHWLIMNRRTTRRSRECRVQRAGAQPYWSTPADRCAHKRAMSWGRCAPDVCQVCVSVCISVCQVCVNVCVSCMSMCPTCGSICVRYVSSVCHVCARCLSVCAMCVCQCAMCVKCVSGVLHVCVTRVPSVCQ